MRRGPRPGERRRRLQDRVAAIRTASGTWDLPHVAAVAATFDVPVRLILHPDDLRPAPRRRGR